MQHREWDFGHPHTARRMKSAGNQGNKVLVGTHTHTRFPSIRRYGALEEKK